MPPDTNSAITRSRKDEVIRENSKACDKIPVAKAVVVDVVAVREAEKHDFRHGVHYRIKHPVIICSFGIIRRINTGFGRSTTNFVTKANFRPLCLKWDFLGLFLDLSGPLSRYLHQNAAKLTKSKKGFKKRVVATLPTRSVSYVD